MWRLADGRSSVSTASSSTTGSCWSGRGQAQNAADAGALAGAVAMAFDANGWTDRTPTGPARAAALQMALRTSSGAQAPDVDVATDVFFTGQPAAMCPPGCQRPTPCIRVDVYRNQARGNPLPALFGLAFGLAQPGRPRDRDRARGRGQRERLHEAVGDSRQMAGQLRRDGADRARQHVDAATTPSRLTTSEGKPGRRFESADVYTPPSASSPGTGFTVAADLGSMVTLKAGSPQDVDCARLCSSRFGCRVYGGISAGGNDYRDNIATATVSPIPIGTTLQSENGNMIGPTAQGVDDLIALDPNADWDPATKTVINSCAQASHSVRAAEPAHRRHSRSSTPALTQASTKVRTPGRSRS